MRATKEVDEYINLEVCTECGGECCTSYMSNKAESYSSLEPLFDYSGPEERMSRFWASSPTIWTCYLIKDIIILDESRKAGRNHFRCAYLGEAGCVLPREKRPPLCREFKCDYLGRLESKSPCARKPHVLSLKEKEAEVKERILGNCQKCCSREDCAESFRRLGVARDLRPKNRLEKLLHL